MAIKSIVLDADAFIIHDEAAAERLRFSIDYRADKYGHVDVISLVVLVYEVNVDVLPRSVNMTELMEHVFTPLGIPWKRAAEAYISMMETEHVSTNADH